MNTDKKEEESRKEKFTSLPHEISRFIYVRNLPLKELYDILEDLGQLDK